VRGARLEFFTADKLFDSKRNVSFSGTWRLSCIELLQNPLFHSAEKQNGLSIENNHRQQK